MSVSKFCVKISCEFEGCDKVQNVEMVWGDCQFTEKKWALREVRRKAQADFGWDRIDGKDYCAEHLLAVQIAQHQEELNVLQARLEALQGDIVWKVVRSTSTGALVSCYAHDDATRTYKVGEKAVPPKYLLDRGYGLLCFEDQESAECFIDDGLFRLFKARATGKMAMRLRQENFSNPNRNPYCSQYTWPRGTVMYESVTLLEEVYVDGSTDPIF